MTPKIVIKRRQKILALLKKNPMSVLDLIHALHGINRDAIYRDLKDMTVLHEVKKRYCHWNGNKNARWIYYINNEELENMDDEFTTCERIVEMLKDGQVINYLTVNEAPESTVYTHIKRLRKKGWNIGERKADASVGRYKEFYLITK